MTFSVIFKPLIFAEINKHTVKPSEVFELKSGVYKDLLRLFIKYDFLEIFSPEINSDTILM